SSRLFRRGDANCSSVGIEFEDAGEPDAAPRTADQYAAGAALMREIAERWSIPLDREHVVGHREVDASQTCPGNLDIDRLVEEARVSAAATPQGHRGMNRLVCLLPVHYDGAGLWVYRLFAHRPGQRLADRRLHGVPIPDEIPRSRWIRTTIRIKHLAGLDERRRQARFAKYAEADPEREYQEAGYDHVLEPPRSGVRWRPR